jgi:protein-disulfide isomerase
MLLKEACGMLQVIAKELQEEEAKLAQVQERIEMRHVTVTRDDRTSTAAPRLRAAQQYAPRGRHRGLKEEQQAKEEQLKDEQQAALKLQLASHRLRTLSRSAVHYGKHKARTC